MQLIGLSGKAHSGKDYLFTEVLAPMGFLRVSFADHFKIWLIGQGKASYEEVFETKPPQIRKLLQEEGTEKGRNVYGPDVWVWTLVAWLRHWEKQWGVERFCVVDVRFPNEAKIIKGTGGEVYRVEAPERSLSSKLTHTQRMHVSETALDGYAHFDGTILNDPGHELDAPKLLRKLASTYLGENYPGELTI